MTTNLADLDPDERVHRRKTMYALLGSDGMATRITNVLARNGITTMEELQAADEETLLDLPNMGDKCMVRLRQLRNPEDLAEDRSIEMYVQVTEHTEAILNKLTYGVGTYYGFGSATKVRQAIEPILNLGKAIGRATAYGPGNAVTDLESDPLIASWLRAAEKQGEGHDDEV